MFLSTSLTAPDWTIIIGAIFLLGIQTVTSQANRIFMGRNPFVFGASFVQMSGHLRGNVIEQNFVRSGVGIFPGPNEMFTALHFSRRCSPVAACCRTGVSAGEFQSLGDLVSLVHIDREIG